MTLYLYTDISGDVSFYSSDNVCIATIILNEEDMYANRRVYTKLLRKIHQRIWVKYDEIQLTASDILRGWGIFAGKNMVDRFWILEQVVDLITKIDAKIICILLDKELIFNNFWNWSGGSKWAKDWIWKLYLEKITKYVADNKKTGKIIFQSLNPVADEHFHSYLHEIMDKNDHYIQMGLMESIEFSQSAKHPGCN